MGIETAILMAVVAGANVYQGMQESKQQKKMAQATAAEGTMQVEQMARKSEDIRLQTARMAATQKTSFLTSGLELEGTPFNVLSDTYALGQKDLIDLQKDIRTTANIYNQRSANYMSASRSAMVGGIIGGVTSAASIYGMSGGFGVENMGGVKTGTPPIPGRKPI